MAGTLSPFVFVAAVVAMRTYFMRCDGVSHIWLTQDEFVACGGVSENRIFQRLGLLLNGRL